MSTPEEQFPSSWDVPPKEQKACAAFVAQESDDSFCDTCGQSVLDHEQAGKPEDFVQPPLIPLTEEEQRAAGSELARLIRDLSALREDEVLRRRAYTADVRSVQRAIDNLAQQIREQGR